MPYTNDPVADFHHHDRQQQELLERQPQCSICDSHIQDECLFVINDELVCKECLIRDFRRDTDEFVC